MNTEPIEFIEVISTSGILPSIASLNTIIYIDKSYYNNDLYEIAKLQTIDSKLKQLKRDIQRCDFYYDGDLTKDIPQDINESLISYCTQAVLGLPISLFENKYSIAEQFPPRRMVVEVWNNTSVIVSKKLTLLGGNVALNFTIIVSYMDHEDDIQVVIKALPSTALS